MRYLHTMVRVTELDASLDFYCNKLGLEEQRRVDVEAGRFSLIFLGAPDNPVIVHDPMSGARIEEPNVKRRSGDRIQRILDHGDRCGGLLRVPWSRRPGSALT